MVVKVHCEVPCPRGVYIVTDAAGTETICVLRENGGCLMNTLLEPAKDEKDEGC
ncbi:uncharacterized protein PHALS_02016 [Plasmopara halstedii]|uniref:Uncharacterized protein n=1 Tax=Plasmopara halstedii TaxID=4781 RepID=A0A0P1AU26_PLAHL|nr:uncharacterized protein PHALS_02016 [Plasmopara halstedii]CEG45738.1 hypothetical protein PHALS_02016 [Plasmopara halstedii]|eukprot:XP_024582107.1 hypothetical protein PHALS_02016 [Plasmopara halstedii]